MKYKVTINKSFWSSAKRLKSKYTNDEFRQIVNEIQESILILANYGKLPRSCFEAKSLSKS